MKKFISDLQVNTSIDSYFVLVKKNLKLTKYDKPYLELTLADKTGRIEGRLWEDAIKFNEKAETGDIVLVKAVVDKYRDDKQLKVDYFEKADERAYSYEDMVRTVENRESILSDIATRLALIKNKWINELAREFLDDKILMKKFIDGIGAKMWHNAYIGGLVEHTHEVMRIADAICDIYPEADRDIVIFGAFTHDIGKVDELDPKGMEYTTEGSLLGHISIGHNILRDKMKEIKNFPRELEIRLEHVILSHHGEYEQQAPVLPKTLEATIVYHTDELVSQTNAVREIKLLEGADGKVWSNYVSIKNRKYYLKDGSGEEWACSGSEKASTALDNEIIKPALKAKESVKPSREKTKMDLFSGE
ncbi:metal dependent phosphohydrolase [Candidatus Omnitrophus magneticus]|uniref:Metal dependent phosphohydrolase n=1 Tax=Candidatus Omnitrophus magneticus TaxID=1609969 RepID=A0A0F0CWM3_9BACT|nr:metal dependent phosphohydrolase [Candidatus Omnitrophus magneticus]